MGSPFPDPTEDEQDHMVRLAHRVAGRFLRAADDFGVLVEDLVAAGWVAFYEHFQHERRWKKVYDAMLDAWSLWRFNVQWRSKKERRERPSILCSIHEHWQESALGGGQRLEARWEARDTLIRLCQHIETRPRYKGLAKGIRGLQLAEGHPLTARERDRLGYKDKRDFSRQKQIIRRLTIDLQQDAA